VVCAVIQTLGEAHVIEKDPVVFVTVSVGGVTLIKLILVVAVQPP
jgi:hypothetical protein